MLLVELNQPEPILEAINFQVLQTFRYVSHLILCAVILWWFQKVVTTDSNLGVALCGRYIRDDTWKLCVLLSARGVVRDIDTSISCSYAWYCLRKCLLHIKCSALRDFFTLGSRVFYFSYFFFMRAREASVLADTSSVQMPRPWAAHETSLAPRTRTSCSSTENCEKKLEKRKGYLLTFRHSLLCHYRLSYCFFLIPANWTTKCLIFL